MAPVEKDLLYRAYLGWCENDGPASERAALSKAEWAKGLGRLLPDGLPAKRVTVEGERRHMLALPDYAACCDHYERVPRRLWSRRRGSWAWPTR